MFILGETERTTLLANRIYFQWYTDGRSFRIVLARFVDNDVPIILNIFASIQSLMKIMNCKISMVVKEDPRRSQQTG